jgi:hypothetical protein
LSAKRLTAAATRKTSIRAAPADPKEHIKCSICEISAPMSAVFGPRHARAAPQKRIAPGTALIFSRFDENVLIRGGTRRPCSPAEGRRQSYLEKFDPGSGYSFSTVGNRTRHSEESNECRPPSAFRILSLPFNRFWPNKEIADPANPGRYIVAFLTPARVTSLALRLGSLGFVTASSVSFRRGARTYPRESQVKLRPKFRCSATYFLVSAQAILSSIPLDECARYRKASYFGSSGIAASASGPLSRKNRVELLEDSERD